MAWPKSVTDHRLSGRLELVWQDGEVSVLSHAALRAACRCGGCEQHRRSGKPVQAGEAIRLTAMIPVADKGLNLVFSDGHDRGIYPWAYFREIGSNQKPVAAAVVQPTPSAPASP